MVLAPSYGDAPAEQLLHTKDACAASWISVLVLYRKPLLDTLKWNIGTAGGAGQQLRRDGSPRRTVGVGGGDSAQPAGAAGHRELRA